MDWKRTIWTLYAVITSRPPVSLSYWLKPAVLLGTYFALLPFDQNLQAHGLSAFVLSVVAMLNFNIWRVMPWIPSMIETDDSPQTLQRRQMWLGVCVTAVLLFADDPVWCQRVFSLLFVGFTVIFALYLLVSPENLGEFPWMGQYFEHGRENAARWTMLGYVAQFGINEYAIAYWNLTDWIVMMAFMPFVIRILVWWTILISDPYWDEPN